MPQGPYRDDLHSVVGELVAMEHDDDVLAVAMVIVRRSGDLRTLSCYDQGGKLPILAGTVVLQQEVLAGVKPNRLPDTARVPGHCKEGDRCVCGGDTPLVRAGCRNWVKR